MSSEYSVQRPAVGSRLSVELYQSFINYLDNESKRMPSKHLLVREMTQTMNWSAKKTNNAIRKKFRNWTKRMVLSNGVLVHKLSNKVIIPETLFFDTIKKIHESIPQHLNVTQTVREIKSRFTWSSKNFGMNLSDVLTALSKCQHKKCQKSVEIIKSKIQLNGSDSRQKLLTEENHKSSDGDEDESSLLMDVNQSSQSVESNPSSENCEKLFKDLLFGIHSMQIHINLFKVHKFRRNQPLRGGIQRCEQLVQQIRSSLP